jgi:hypothetical protein
VSPVKYELGFYTPEDDILHSHRRENLKSYGTNVCFQEVVAQMLSTLIICSMLVRACPAVVRRGAMLQAERSKVRFAMTSMGFSHSIFLTIPAALQPSGDSASNRNHYQVLYREVKRGLRVKLKYMWRSGHFDLCFLDLGTS